MNKQKILIYDDENRRTEDFQRKLDEGLKKAGQSQNFDIVPLKNNAFQESISVLEQRRIAFRDKKNICREESTKNGAEEIDNASIFIIDYDLLGSQVGESPLGSLTGEIVAYLVRCFSKCKLIVGLNQYGSNPFDLTLRGDLDSFADLNLGEDQLDNPYLWKGDWGGDRRKFRPWHWPNLSDALRNFNKRVEEVEKNMDTLICEFLGFDRELFRLLPREIVQFIEKQEQKEHFQTTFREFVTDSGNGLRFKDSKALEKGINDHVLARVGAARISKWLERLVLPEQDILVDAPHLISRYPSLITGNDQKIHTWNKIAQLVSADELALNTDLIKDYQFPKKHWVSRPVWFWDKVRECERVREVIEPWLTVKPDWVFCEDTSYFYHRENCREFLADTASPFTRRFVKYFDAVDYRPRVRFSL